MRSAFRHHRGFAPELNKKIYFLIDQQCAWSIEQKTDQESLVTRLSQLKTSGDQFGN